MTSCEALILFRAKMLGDVVASTLSFVAQFWLLFGGRIEGRERTNLGGDMVVSLAPSCSVRMVVAK